MIPMIMKTVSYRIHWLIISACIAIIIGFLSLIKLEGGQPLFPHQDKIHHFLAYLTLSYALFQANRKFYSALILSSLYGVIIELLQGQTGYREFSFLDMVANILGSGFGVLASKRMTLINTFLEKYFLSFFNFSRKK